MRILPSDFWAPVPIRPAPLLAELRDLVLTRSEKRALKWKWRLAPDVVLQIQPKLTLALLKFECRAIRCENADLNTLLAKSTQIGRPNWRLSFDLSASTPEQWSVKSRGCGWRHGCDGSLVVGLRDEIVAAFEQGRFDKIEPTMMLSSHCLCCGKGLTDPVSQARHIGPECWGSASTNLPRIFNTMEA